MYEANGPTKFLHACRNVVCALESFGANKANWANIIAGVAGHWNKGVAYVVFDPKVNCQKSPLYIAFRWFLIGQEEKTTKMLDRARRALDNDKLDYSSCHGLSSVKGTGDICSQHHQAMQYLKSSQIQKHNSTTPLVINANWPKQWKRLHFLW